jgi:solute carrier family 35 protein E3
VNALAVNISVYWVMGQISQLKYNMIGHMKFVLTIIFGVIIFKEKINLQQVVCIIAILMSISLYTHFCMQEANNKSNETKSIEDGKELAEND